MDIETAIITCFCKTIIVVTIVQGTRTPTREENESSHSWLRKIAVEEVQVGKSSKEEEINNR
jgi:phage gp36-like protein